MVVAHVIGRGAPELVRFWGESPLVREPDVTLFGLERLDPPEQEFLSKSPMRHIDAADIQSKGGSAAARDGLAYVHADAHEFVLHLDTDVIAVDEFPAVNVPGADGLRLAEVRAALAEFAKHKNLLGLVVAQYNPDKDADGSGAKKLVDLACGGSLRAAGSAQPAPAISGAEPVASIATPAATDSPSDEPTEYAGSLLFRNIHLSFRRLSLGRKSILAVSLVRGQCRAQ